MSHQNQTVFFKKGNSVKIDRVTAERLKVNDVEHQNNERFFEALQISLQSFEVMVI